MTEVLVWKTKDSVEIDGDLFVRYEPTTKIAPETLLRDKLKLVLDSESLTYLPLNDWEKVVDIWNRLPQGDKIGSIRIALAFRQVKHPLATLRSAKDAVERVFAGVPR